MDDRSAHDAAGTDGEPPTPARAADPTATALPAQHHPRVVTPEATRWHFPAPQELPDDDLVAIGADLEPGTLLAAYTAGLFPMPLDHRQLGWFSPDPRGILWPSRLRVTRSLRQSIKRYEVTVDQAFDEVIAACANPARSGAWIDTGVEKAYRRLHRLGWAHSVEVWDEEGLAGGLYGLAIGRLFAGESMFHHRRDASKVALVRLAELVGTEAPAFIDVQWLTPHLASLGAEDVSRPAYIELLDAALGQGIQPYLAGWFDSLGSAQVHNQPADGTEVGDHLADRDVALPPTSSEPSA